MKPTRYTKDRYLELLKRHVALVYATTEDKWKLLSDEFCLEAILEGLWTPPGKPE